MNHAVGGLLLLARYLLNAGTLVIGFGGVVFFVLWMHAPVGELVRWAVPIALWPLALAWVCGRIGRHLRDNTPVVPSSPAVRLLLACAGLGLVGTAAPLVLPVYRQYRCSVDPSQAVAARALQFQRDGFDRVCTGALDRFDISFSSLARATRKLAFTPVDLAHTPFAELRDLGGKVEFMSEVPSRLYRGFRTGDGHRLTLFEHDMSADGSRTWRDPQYESERINGVPARLTVMQDAAGASISLLSWVEERRAYELWIDANVNTTPRLRERLFALAASMPASIPGCPNEVPPKLLRIGADGSPESESVGAGLTVAEMDAMFNVKKRPCK